MSEDKSLSMRKQQREQTGGFVQNGVHCRWEAGDIPVTPLSYSVILSIIIMENGSKDVGIELQQAKVFQRAMNESSIGKRLQPLCKGWNQS